MEAAALASAESPTVSKSQTLAADQKLSEASFPEKLREIARRELNWLGVVTGFAEPLPLKR